MHALYTPKFVRTQHLGIRRDKYRPLYVQLDYGRSDTTRFASLYLAEHYMTVLKGVVDIIADQRPGEVYKYPRHDGTYRKQRHQARDVAYTEEGNYKQRVYENEKIF